MQRYPALADVGLRTFFCGPESFTPDLHPMLGPAPEVRRRLRRGRAEQPRHPASAVGSGSVVAQWIVDGRPPVDVTHYAVERALPHETTRRFRGERVARASGCCSATASGRPSSGRTGRGVRRSVLHDQLAALGRAVRSVRRLGVPALVRRARRRRPTTAPRRPGAAPRPSPTVAEEHRAVREAVGVMDMSLMSKFQVEGPDAGTVLNRLSISDVDGEPVRVVYTQWCDVDGGLLADLTVTKLDDDRFLVVVERRDPPAGADDAPPRAGAGRGRDHHRRHRRDHAALRAGSALARPAGSRCHPTTGPTRPSPTSPPARSRSARRGSSRCGSPTSASSATSCTSRPTRARRCGRRSSRPARRTACGRSGLLAMCSLRLEKGYRDYGVDIENTDDPLVAGLAFTIAWDKPGGFVGREALEKRRGDRSARMVARPARRPRAAAATAASRCCCDGEWVGYVRAGDFGTPWALGRARGGRARGRRHRRLAGRDGFEVDDRRHRVPATLSLRPFYDPDRLRIRG